MYKVIKMIVTMRFINYCQLNLFCVFQFLYLYFRIRMYDYQAICIDIIVPSGPASLLKTVGFYILLKSLILNKNVIQNFNKIFIFLKV